MKTFSNMKIGTRLGLGFGIVVILMIAVAAVGVTQLSSINEINSTITDDLYPKTILANNISDNVNMAARAMRNALLVDNKEEAQKEINRIYEGRKVIVENLEQLQKAIKDNEGKEILKKLTDARAAYVAEQDRFIDLIANNKKEDAIKLLLGGIRQTQRTYFQAIDDLIEFQNKLITQGKEEADQTYKSARNMIAILSITALALAVGIALWTTRGITRPLDKTVGIANQIAEGDLTAKIEVASKDETGQLLAAIDHMVKNLKGIVFQVNEASNQVSTASEQIAQANQNLSQSITEQAASVEETSSTMEEMSASIRQTADNAREANKLSQAAKTSAESGIKVMGDTINAMDEINKSSSKIANISNVIEEIAFQTNLLALNAAVEAARAGEHGKGFAVVASEIRSLAQRASQSAKEITGLIEDSVNKTGKGVQLAQELRNKLGEIEISVKKVADMMDEVAAASQEQASGTNQVNTAMMQIDKATQQNASIVEETASASEELAAQAKELMNLISFFKVDEAFSAERETKGKGGSISLTKKMTQRPQPVLAHASTAPRKGAVSAETKGKSDEGFEEF